MRSRTRTRAIWLVLLSLLLAGLAWLHHVPSTPTTGDVQAIRAMLAITGHDHLLQTGPANFNEQIAAIVAVQDAVLRAAPVNEGIPLGELREPDNLLKAGEGLCYDRSRSIEKALELLGMETRHVSVYSTSKAGSATKALISPGNASHALTEVRTLRGWLVVDSNARWVSLTEDGRPVDIESLRTAGSNAFKWSALNVDGIDRILTESFVQIYGLYSRHGKFYPPMTPVPDVNWRQLTHNFSL